VFVASYTTKAWLPARDAAYLRSDRIATPMGAHYVAFESAAARDGDPATAGGQRLSAADVFGARLPGGERP